MLLSILYGVVLFFLLVVVTILMKFHKGTVSLYCAIEATKCECDYYNRLQTKIALTPKRKLYSVVGIYEEQTNSFFSDILGHYHRNSEQYSSILGYSMMMMMMILNYLPFLK